MPEPSRMPSCGNSRLAIQRADDADDEVADEAEAGPLHDLPGEPPGDQADQQDDGETFA
jgi:hypothetical protein